MRKVLVSGFAVAVAAAALIVAGCGSGSSGSSGAAAVQSTADGMTAAQILAKAGKAMDGVKSARFTVALAVTTGASASSAVQMPVLLHVVGAAGGAKGAASADVTVAGRVGATPVALRLKAAGHHSWLGYRGKWYALPAGKAEAAGSGASSSLGSSAAIAGLGVDPQAWARSSTVTVEQRNGAKVYQVVTTADTAKIMSDLIKLLTSPVVAKAAAANGSAGMELNLLKQDPALLKSLQKALTAASAQEWLDASTFRLEQGKLHARFRVSSGAATSVFAIDVTYYLSAFGQPVKVVAPKHALPFKQLSQGFSKLSPVGAAGL